ncbi:hypothetical protein D4741_19970 [Pseudoalteromonas gelatinilytica]|uniref:Core-binding (CB) domain-containing protein n=1 Tax=Pseudoalteromonas gelatinilytica TaxID=1703256 RepID=A0A3A3EDR5_9GAMM|nr:site-specific integrase [Pseudoalteromonas profundi]RJF32050.1 hypothetical protein D4741_19970 [Pseudoalteromonas profundi]
MIQEYIEERRLKGISEKTLELEEAYISLFLSFVEGQYEKSLELYEIRSSDVTRFLDEQSENNSDHTIIRKISVLRNWFDYLWRMNKIPIDYMAKFKYHRVLDPGKSTIDFSYQQLLEGKEKVLRSDISLNAKVVFLLIMRGIRVRDIRSFTLDWMGEEEGVTTLIFNGGMEREFHVIFTEPEEIIILSDAKIQAIFRGVPYLVSTRIVGEGAYTQFTENAMHTALSRLQEVLGLPVTAEKVRKSYLSYLINEKGYTIDDLVHHLGFRWETAAGVKKSIIES